MKNQCNDSPLTANLQYHFVGFFKVFYCIDYQLFFDQFFGDKPVGILLKQGNNIDARFQR
jgi:hypothetical protein